MKCFWALSNICQSFKSIWEATTLLEAWFPAVELRLIFSYPLSCFFFLYYFINTSRNGEGLKLSSIFICPGLFFYKSSFRKRKCDLYYRRKLILLFTWHSPKYGIPVNDTCHWCPKKACDVSRLDAWTWGRQGKKSSNTDRPMFLSWIPFYPLLLFVKDSAWAVSKFSRVLLYWRDTLHNSICKNTD